MTELELLGTALSAELGLIVNTEDPTSLKNALYREARKHEEFSCLSFLTSPINPNGQIWIVKRPEQEENHGPA